MKCCVTIMQSIDSYDETFGEKKPFKSIRSKKEKKTKTETSQCLIHSDFVCLMFALYRID